MAVKRNYSVKASSFQAIKFLKPQPLKYKKRDTYIYNMYTRYIQQQQQKRDTYIYSMYTRYIQQQQQKRDTHIYSMYTRYIQQQQKRLRNYLIFCLREVIGMGGEK